eukprot:365648-Chlamydomonas_euryale.AAC.4
MRAAHGGAKEVWGWLVAPAPNKQGGLLHGLGDIAHLINPVPSHQPIAHPSPLPNPTCMFVAPHLQAAAQLVVLLCELGRWRVPCRRRRPLAPAVRCILGLSHAGRGFGGGVGLACGSARSLACGSARSVPDRLAGDVDGVAQQQPCGRPPRELMPRDVLQVLQRTQQWRDVKVGAVHCDGTAVLPGQVAAASVATATRRNRAARLRLLRVLRGGRRPEF